MKEIQSADIAIAYEEQGQGRPILLVHGFPLDHSMWAAQVAALASEHRVIAPDLRGFGQTPLAASDAEADKRAARGVSMEEYADDLAVLLDGIGVSEPVTFVGFSMGGYVAWQFWKRHRARLQSLILCDTRAAADADEARKARLDMAEHVLETGAAQVAEQMIPKLFATRSIAKTPDLVEAARRVIASTDPRAIAAAQRGMAARPDVTDWLPQIDLPALVIVGAEDAISRVEEMQAIAKALPQAEFHVIGGAGHMAPVENSNDANTALVGFLRRS